MRQFDLLYLQYLYMCIPLRDDIGDLIFFWSLSDLPPVVKKRFLAQISFLNTFHSIIYGNPGQFKFLLDCATGK